MESLYNLSSLVSNGPRDNVGFTDVKLNRKTALHYYGIAAEDRPELAAFVRDNCDSVADEITVFRAAKRKDPVGYARRILTFAILSAQVNFEENVYCLRSVMTDFDRMTDAGSIRPYLRAPYKGVGKMRNINGYKDKAQYLAEALPFLRGIRPDDMTLERIANLRGVGPKVAAFTMALWDDRAPVFTLDVWMYRLTAAILGKPTRVKVSAPRLAYDLNEGDWLAWCERQLPDYSPFLIQWTLWNGCFGEHKSHLGILG